MKKKSFGLAVYTAFLIAPLFPQGLVPEKMEDLMTQIKDIFNGPLVRSILVICLCGCAVAYGFNKDNEKMKRNCIAIGIAIAIIGIAGFVVDKIWEASKM